MKRLIEAARRRLFGVPEDAPAHASSGAAREMQPGEYREVIRRLREIVSEHLPSGAHMLVVSRGDEALVRLEDRVAWHFPRAGNGKYAGYHPHDSEEALEHLKCLQAEGARYFLVPAPSFWWLDYYPGLFQHLVQWTTMVWDDESCLIFELDRPPVRTPGAPASEIARPLQRMLEALLPAGARVAVLTSGDASLLAIEGRRALHFPHGAGGRYCGGLDAAQALEQLGGLQKCGVDFLVIPHVSPSWLDRQPGFFAQLQGRYGTIALREDVCTVFDLNGLGASRSR